jgi:uncharacterized membrane protein YphA (DoxX/SURF4 family)
MLDPIVGYLIVVSFALLFARAGIHKLRGLDRFVDAFSDYRVMPATLNRPVALAIPILELAIAMLLLWGPGRRLALLGGIGVLITYAAGMALNLARGKRDLECGCGGGYERRSIAAWMVWRNLLLVLPLCIALMSWSTRSFDLSDILTLTGGLTVCATLYTAIDRLLGDVRPRAIILRGTP